jgi:uncharacterized membrane protein YkoI
MFATTRRRVSAVAAVLAIAAIAGAGLAFGMASGDDEHPITGEALQQASAAALAHTGAGEVTETEVGDEEGYYEVEVTLPDGSQVDVHLDEEFNVLHTENDDAGEDDD